MKHVSTLLAGGAMLVALAYLAVCGLLYFTQRSHIYFPTGRSSDVPSFTLHRGAADVVVSTNERKGNRAVLYFGGNAEDVSRSIASLVRAFPDAGIYAMHYRSYGGSTGTPSERALVADGLGLLDLIARTHPHITIVGRSLGSGIAVQAASARSIDRLVLVTPYNSIAELAAEHFKLFPTQFILRDKFESWRYVRRLRVPTTIIVAGNDRIIPNGSSRKLAEAFPAGAVDVVVIPDADHNNVSEFPDYLTALSGTYAPAE